MKKKIAAHLRIYNFYMTLQKATVFAQDLSEIIRDVINTQPYYSSILSPSAAR